MCPVAARISCASTARRRLIHPFRIISAVGGALRVVHIFERPSPAIQVPALFTTGTGRHSCAPVFAARVVKWRPHTDLVIGKV